MRVFIFIFLFFTWITASAQAESGAPTIANESDKSVGNINSIPIKINTGG